MARVKAFGDGTIKASGSHWIYEIPIVRTKVDSISQLESLKKEDPLFMDLSDVSVKGSYVRLVYTMNKEFVPLSRIQNKHRIQKIMVCQSLLQLENFQDTSFVTLLEPNNLFYNSRGRVKGLYRGIHGILPGDKTESFFQKIQGLIQWILCLHTEDPLVRNIEKADDIDGLRFIMQRELEHQQAEFMTVYQGQLKHQTKMLWMSGGILTSLIVGGLIGVFATYQILN